MLYGKGYPIPFSIKDAFNSTNTSTTTTTTTNTNNGNNYSHDNGNNYAHNNGNHHADFGPGRQVILTANLKY